MSISFPLQDMLHEGHMVSIDQWDLAVTEVLLQTAMEQAEQQLVWQGGGALGRIFILHCDGGKRQIQEKQFGLAPSRTCFTSWSKWAKNIGYVLVTLLPPFGDYQESETEKHMFSNCGAGQIHHISTIFKKKIGLINKRKG